MLRRHRIWKIAAASIACIVSPLSEETAHAQLRGQTLVSGFHRRSPSSRIRPTAPSSSSSSRAAHPRGPQRCDPADGFPRSDARDRCAAASAACSDWRSRPTTPPAAASSSTSPTRRATRSSPGSGDRPIRWSPTPTRGSICRWTARAARRSSRSRSRTTTAATSRSVPMAISTSAWAMAVRATIPSIARRIRRSCSARCCASTSTFPTPIRSGYRIPPDNPFVGAAPAASRRDLGLRPAEPLALQLRRSARGGTGALVIGDVGQNRWEEIDYEPAGRGGRNYGWRNREGAHNNVTSLPPAYLPLIDPIHEYDRTDRQLGHRWVRLSRPRARRGVSRPLFLRATSYRPRLVDRAHDRRTGEARASD